jgi:hypothetical protein
MGPTCQISSHVSNMLQAHDVVIERGLNSYADQFSLLGDNSSVFQVYRRLNTTIPTEKLSLRCKRDVKVDEHG